MKYIYLLFSLLAPLLGFTQTQPFHIAHGCSYDEAQLESDVYVFDASSEADRIVLEIVDALGLQKNFIVKSSNVPNALATTDGGQRYILYSTTFLEKFKADANTRWAAYSVLAHEIGHHLNGHDFSETDSRKRKLLEMEADQFSGSVLRMLGATLPESQAGIETFGLQGESNTHPSKTARREAIAGGWKKRDEWLRERGTTTTPARREEPRQTDKPITAPPATAGTFSQDRCEGCPAMVFVKGGAFDMGFDGVGGNNSEKPVHRVNLPDFFLGKYEVTQAEWRAVMGNNPAGFKNCDQCPVENVSWDDAQDFIQKLNTRTGKSFRLPSEAEWEYAARGGQASKGYDYAGHNSVGMVAWWYGNSGNKTQKVGQRKANELMIYDMNGNVWEWCDDYWHYNYDNAPTDGSAWIKDGDRTFRVLRGGSWKDDTGYHRVTTRNNERPEMRNNRTGFRLAHGL